MLKWIDNKIIKIPQLNLGRIINKQKWALYPYNLDTQGWMVPTKNEKFDMESSNESFEEEDAIILFEEGPSTDNTKPVPKSKNSNLIFDPSFMNDLSNQSKCTSKEE